MSRDAYPTLTQVPPDLPFSIRRVLAPYHPAALLAAPEPPDPPPMTIKSYCFATGAMLVVLNVLDISITLRVADCVMESEEVKIERASMSRDDLEDHEKPGTHRLLIQWVLAVLLATRTC